jgi:hypothetical protein
VAVDLIESPFVLWVRSFLGSRPSQIFEGTASQLLSAMASQLPATVRDSRLWPNTPIGLGSRLARSKNSLAAAGIHLRTAKSGLRFIRLELRDDTCELSSSTKGKTS